jgi:translocation protein SEC63
MLEYDNSAFYYFSLTLLAIYLLPGTWFAVSELFGALFGSGDVGTKARTKAEQDKARQLKQQTTGWARLNTTAYKTNLVCLVLCWAMFLYLISLVMNDGEVQTFDPWNILGIEESASVTEIKKAYRRLSLKFHPDKNPNNKAAEEMFMKVSDCVCVSRLHVQV